MSYHYRGQNKREVLLRQLSQVENDLNTKNKSLQRLKLEAEFYEDKDKPNKDKLSLADQIMNELIAPSQPPQLKPYTPPQPRQEYHQIEPRQQYRPNQPKQDNNRPAAFKPVHFDNNQRENHFINEREIQKNKMQNQKHEGLFPNSSDHNRVRSFGKQQHPQQYVAEKDKIDPKLSPYGLNPSFKKATSPQVEPSYNPSFNPFVRAEEVQKQKREESHREYLRELELQRQEQQRLKEQRQREKKQLKGQFHDFLPNKVEPQKPITIKKNDPNSKPPKVEQIMGNFSQFDTNLIKSKGIEIKSKYKKGKITYQQFQREINNLRKQYNGNLDDLLDNKVVDRERERQKEVNQPITQRSEEPIQLEQQPFSNSLPIKPQSINYSQFVPQQELPARGNNSLNYTLPPQQMPYPMPAHVPPQYVELMRKMFEVCLKEVKEVYSQRLVSQDQAYQETLNKFVQYTQNNFMTQQIPPIQASQQQQKEFYSDAKQIKDLFEKESNIKKKVNPPPSAQSLPYQADNNSYYDKSLSAIASKIPYLKTEKQQKMKESEVQVFYSKKYKVRKMEKFAFLSDPKQSNIEIPSTSTYLRNSNALQELEGRFHQDLTELRKLQSQQNSQRFASKLNQNAAYSSQRRVLIDSKRTPIVAGGQQSEIQQNPFLKKHISTDDNIMTFNEKQLRMNSPINSYSPKSKKEILEQDQYQTEPRVRDDAKKVPNYVQEYEQRLNAIPNKALNFIAMNNEVLRKYEKTQESKKEHIMIQDASDVKQKDSNYFTNNDISPVKRNDYYEESLETIRSDFEPPNSKRPTPNHPIQSKQQLEPLSKSKPKQSQLSLPEQQSQMGMIGYSQTVQSIQESSARNSRPPVAKRRTISKKKESSIARSKLNQDSSLSKGYNQSLRQDQPLKFDSNVYESQYQESSQMVTSKKPHPQITANARFQTQDKDPNIEIYAPTIIAPKSALEIEANYSALEQKPKAGGTQSKLKSLEEARKLAKEYRVKATEESKDYRSVEQRFSELQSFMTKRGDDSVNLKKESKGKESKGKDIMRMLQQLQEDENYKQDFQSYREQSEHYQ